MLFRAPLLPPEFPSDTTEALEDAAGRGDAELVHRLLPTSRPQAHRSRALRFAAMNGNAALVEMLTPHVDPTVAWRTVEREVLWGSPASERYRQGLCALTQLSAHVDTARLRVALDRIPPLQRCPQVHAALLRHELSAALPVASAPPPPHREARL